MQSQHTSFYQLGLAPNMIGVLDRMGIVTPTAIQSKAIPPALEGKDVVGIAQTGTGKTLAFGIPVIQRLSADGGLALILAPTRDLAIQIDEALMPILKHFDMRSAVLIGGVPIRPQINDLRKEPHVLIATPGRMIDHMEQNTVDLRAVTSMILDEADRMLDMGFLPQVQRILDSLYPQRQTMLFSATMPPDIIKLAAKYMHLPVQIEVAPTGTAAEDVSQELFIIKEEDKEKVLPLLLRQYRGTVLVFTRTKIRAKKVTRLIRRSGERVTELHSDRSMEQRQEAMEGFKNGRYRILVATDIAARGIDVSQIELVINYDLPDDAENYVHRIGRTGRAGEQGHAVSFATPRQGEEVSQIEKLMRQPIPRGRHERVRTHSFTAGDSASKPKGSSSGRRRPPSGRKHRRFSGQRNKPRKK